MQFRSPPRHPPRRRYVLEQRRILASWMKLMLAQGIGYSERAFNGMRRQTVSGLAHKILINHRIQIRMSDWNSLGRFLPTATIAVLLPLPRDVLPVLRKLSGVVQRTGEFDPL